MQRYAERSAAAEKDPCSTVTACGRPGPGAGDLGSRAVVSDSSRRVVDAGRRLGISVEISRFPEGTKTAAEAAAAVGCEVAAIVKSLVFEVDGEPVVALVPGDRRLDTAALARLAGGEAASRAALEAVRQATGYAAGGTPPFGHATPVRVFADDHLRRQEVVWAAGGTPDTVFPIVVEDLGRVTGATWGAISE
jgi:Cys-tRNA(Pro) deacylase